MPQKQGKALLKKISQLLHEEHSAHLFGEPLRKEILRLAFLWIENEGQPITGLSHSPLSPTLQKFLGNYLFLRQEDTPLLEQLHQLALLSEALHPAPRAQGVFYTPPQLVRWLVRRSFKYVHPGHFLRFCVYDPACGSGLFLWASYVELRRRHPRCTEAQSRYWMEHLLGTDTDPLALQVAAFGLKQLWRRDYPGAPFPKLQLHPLDTLSLSSVSQTAEAGHFRLGVQDQLPQLTQVNLIIGNPPYLGEKGHRNAFQVLKHPLWKPDYRPRGDLYYYFYFVALHLLKQSKVKDAVASLLTPNYFFSATQARHLRERLWEDSVPLECVDFDALRLFSGAGGQHNQNLIFRAYHPPSEDPVEQQPRQRSQKVGLHRITARGKFTPEKLKYIQSQEIPILQWGNKAPDHLLNWSNSGVLESLVQDLQGEPLHTKFQVFQGIVTGADSLSATQQKKYKIDRPVGSEIFVISPNTYEKLRTAGVAESYFRPWNKSSAITPQGVLPSHHWLIYLQRHIDHLPLPLEQHLLPFKALLSARREVTLKQMKWFHIQWPRLPERFEGPKLVLPQRARNCRTTFIDSPFYASADVYFIHTRAHIDQPELRLRALAALLNHPLYTLIQWLTGKRKGRMIELYHTPLSELKIPVMDPDFCHQLLNATASEAHAVSEAPAILNQLLKGLGVAVPEKQAKDISERLWEWYRAR